jgi:PAS domain S-box-containing protein
MGMRERASQPTWPPTRVSGFSVKKPESQPAELEQSEMLSLCQTLIRSEPIFICDLNGRFLFANEKMESILRTPSDELRSKKVADFVYHNEYPKLLDVITELRESSESKLRRFTVHTRDGEELVLSARAALMMSGGEPHSIEVLIRDVTDAAFDEQANRRLSALAAAAKVARSAGHDIKNFLNPAYALIDYLNKIDPDRLTPDRIIRLKKIAETAGAAVEKVDAIIKEMMLISSPGLRTVDSVDLNPILRVLMDEMEAPYLERTDYLFCLDLDGSIPFIRGDRLMLERAFYNVMVNSLEAMPQGGTLRVRSECVTTNEGKFIKVTISDTGCGMTDQVKERLFDPEFTTKGEKGNGIGLVLTSKSIVDHNGWIEVTSSPGKGSKFEFFIPAL